MAPPIVPAPAANASPTGPPKNPTRLPANRPTAVPMGPWSASCLTVTFPLARTGVAAGAIFAFVFSLDDVAVSIFLSDPHRYTLPVALVSMLHANFDLTIAAVAVLIIGASIGLMLLLDWMVGLDRVVGAGYYRT